MPSRHEAAAERTRHPVRPDDLDRLIEAEIEALTRPRTRRLPQPPAEAPEPARERGLSPSDLRFIDRAAEWLSRRPDPDRILQLLRDRVLGAAAEDPEATIDPDGEEAPADGPLDPPPGEPTRNDTSLE